LIFCQTSSISSSVSRAPSTPAIDSPSSFAKRRENFVRRAQRDSARCPFSGEFAIENSRSPGPSPRAQDFRQRFPKLAGFLVDLVDDVGGLRPIEANCGDRRPISWARKSDGIARHARQNPLLAPRAILAGLMRPCS
jgi:hypothetical protein